MGNVGSSNRETLVTRHTHPHHVQRSIVRTTVVALLLALHFGVSAEAAIVGINTPVTSTASIYFDDTNSSAPPSGITNSGPTVSPWTGAPLTLPPTTDPMTGDFATGSIDATFVPATNIYALNLNAITLTQAAANTGFADLGFTFNVEYQLDGAGLPLQATLYPNFLVNGTVQSIPGSFASVSGFINYSGVNTAGTISVLETVNYNSIWTTPGPFTGTAFGIPVNGTTPLLPANSTLIVSGFIHFIVDPASINAQSVQVPEPSTYALAVIGVVALLSVRRRTARSIDQLTFLQVAGIVSGVQ